MSELGEKIRDEVLALAKGEAGNVWNEMDSAFVKERAGDVGELAATLITADSEDRPGIRREIKMAKAAILLRVSRAHLRGGNALKAILSRVFSTVFNLLLSNLPELIGM